jgi:hypothetical protein
VQLFEKVYRVLDLWNDLWIFMERPWQTVPYVLTDRDMLSRMCKFVKRYSDAEEGSPMNQDVRSAVVAILLVLVLSCGSRPGSVGA